MSIALAGLAMGFLGSSHCVGMCGGIAGALSATPAGPGSRGRANMQRSISYNVGRIASYTLMGVLAGTFGAALAGLGGSEGMLALRVLAALLIIATGLYVAGWSGVVTGIERLGGGLWRRLAPAARRARESTSPVAALCFGALWGWLPCGLVYSALAVAAASGSAIDGALTMAAFGLGTLPALLSIGLFAGRGASLLRSHTARRAAGMMVVVFGAWTLAAAASTYATAAASGKPACHEAAGVNPIPALRSER
ncbi:MAG: sulfite exporter TauE/SafE family protein [Candidatus Binatia bacterium]